MFSGTKDSKLSWHHSSPADILGNRLVPADTVKNLGVKFDSCLNMSKQVSITISSCYYHIKDLRRIRRHLTKSVAITLCNALVGSKIDYCNALYYGINDKLMQRLQRVQNTLCRIVTPYPPFLEYHWSFDVTSLVTCLDFVYSLSSA